MVKAKNTLELGARHAEVVQAALQHWLRSNALSESQATQLADTIVVQTFDWEKFAKYSLRLAVLFLVVAVSSVVFEKGFLRIYRRIVALPPAVRGAATGVIAVGVHLLAYQRSQTLPQQKYANEAIHAIGAMFFALAAFQLLEQLHESFERSRTCEGEDASQSKAEDGNDEKSRERKKKETKERERLMRNALQGVMLGLATVYATVALASKSNLIWSFAMLVFGYCCGAMGGYGGGFYWIDVESPFIFILLGSSLIGVARLMRLYPITEPLWATTRIWGLLYFFVPLWILSIYGSDDYFETSSNRLAISARARMFLWSLVFFSAAAGSVWHGLRYDDSTTKGFGLTFVGINLYTKFFECFWGWSKPVFFGILAGSFAVMGRYAENVWNVSLESM